MMEKKYNFQLKTDREREEEQTDSLENVYIFYICIRSHSWSKNAAEKDRDKHICNVCAYVFESELTQPMPTQKNPV